MKQHGIYLANEQYYDMLREIGSAVDYQKQRPLLYALPSQEHEGLYFLIPITTLTTEAKRQKIESFMTRRGIASSFYEIGRVAGRDVAFKISGALPVTEKYVREWTLKGQHYVVQNKKVLENVEQKLKHILSYENRNPNRLEQRLTAIQNKLLAELNRERNQDRLMDDLPRGGKKPVSEKSQALLKQAEEGIKEFLESDKYKHFLKTMSKFHQYSVNNTILIAQQKPDAQLVAGFKAWQSKFKRHVNKGEKAIKIIGCRPHERWVEKEVNGKTEKQKVKGFSFFPVSVFDVSQTAGEPLPQLTTELTASVHGYRDLYHAIKRSTDFKIGFEEITSGAKGYCHMGENRIALNKGMSEAQTIKTLIHEVTHADLHAPEFQDKTVEKTSKHVKETEAESVAFVVCEHYGIDTSDYSFPYLGAWAKDSELSELKESFERIQTQADDLIQRIDTNLEDVQKEREQTKEQETPEKTEPTQEKKLSLDEKIKQAESKADTLNSERKKDQLLQNQKSFSRSDTKKEDTER
ncbi:hypothetical protein MPC59_003026 [Listeria monocytogenes]|nr:hypothetical protein [Listeria monocytogenes]